MSLQEVAAFHKQKKEGREYDKGLKRSTESGSTQKTKEDRKLDGLLYFSGPGSIPSGGITQKNEDQEYDEDQSKTESKIGSKVPNFQSNMYPQIQRNSTSRPMQSCKFRPVLSGVIPIDIILTWAAISTRNVMWQTYGEGSDCRGIWMSAESEQYRRDYVLSFLAGLGMENPTNSELTLAYDNLYVYVKDCEIVEYMNNAPVDLYISSHLLIDGVSAYGQEVTVFLAKSDCMRECSFKLNENVSKDWHTRNYPTQISHSLQLTEENCKKYSFLRDKSERTDGGVYHENIILSDDNPIHKILIGDSFFVDTKNRVKIENGKKVVMPFSEAGYNELKQKCFEKASGLPCDKRFGFDLRAFQQDSTLNDLVSCNYVVSNDGTPCQDAQDSELDKLIKVQVRAKINMGYAIPEGLFQKRNK